MITGPELRAHREACGKPLRFMARKLGYSHGHLSKVEAGDRPGDNVVIGYEAILGPIKRHGTGPGRMTLKARQHFSARIAAAAVGGQLSISVKENVSARIRSVARQGPRPTQPSELLATARLLLEERTVGAGHVAHAALRWIAGLDLDSPTIRETAGVLALAATRSAVAGECFFESRDLLVIAVWGLYQNPDLRSRALRVTAELLLDSGYTADAGEVVYLAGRGVSDEEQKAVDELHSRITSTATVREARAAAGEPAGSEGEAEA